MTMGKHKTAKIAIPTDPQLKVEIVGGQIAEPPAVDAILEANDGYFKWIASTSGQSEADKARDNMRASLEFAQQHTDESLEELETSKNIVRVTRAN
jgi:hypothetical protein